MNHSLLVISYIASYYRKYKIWLRRTRHNKRNYEVIIAIDDSSSMSENNSGSVTIEALVTPFTGEAGVKICITTSTSAGLEQILPWIYYHKVIGVSNFFLFVEGKAATPVVSIVLKSFPVHLLQNVKLIHRTKELEEQQAKSSSLMTDIYHAARIRGYQSPKMSNTPHQILEDYHELVNANKLLAEFIIHHCDDTLNMDGTNKDTSSIAAPRVPMICTDSAKITRKRSKPDKHGHGNEKSAK
ncbi:hypothetical protein Tco_0696073 [Tanacetum coccineum]